jgi:hypothetical protein
MDPSNPQRFDPIVRPEDFKNTTLAGSRLAPRKHREGALETLGRYRDRASAWLARHPSVRRGAVSAAIVLVCAGSAVAWATTRPRAVPDVFDAELDDVLDYTLVSEDFNKLPIDERLRLLRELMKKIRGMDSGDSAMMAAFAEGITGKARAQLQRNAEKLAIDVWDKFATGYANFDGPDRERYLDQAAVEMARLMRELGGQPVDDVDDNDLLEQMKRQAKQDEQRMPGAGGAIDRDRVAPFLNFVDQVGQRGTSPAQRDRMAEFGRDMTRHLRGYK